MYKAKSETNDSPKSVGFFHHFIVNFLHPYGIAHMDLTHEDVVLKRVAPMNCEWILRPKVATSEFADTIEQNLNYLASCESPFLDNDIFTGSHQKMQKSIDALQKLNTTNEKGPATGDGVKTFLKTMLTDDADMDDFFESMVKAGSSMYLMGIHYSVAKTILTNPE